jgi:ribosomal RNA-processing protein 12
MACREPFHEFACGFPFFSCLPAKKLGISQDLQAHARDLWGLLPSFCCHPTDTYQNVGALAERLIKFLKEDSFMHKIIAVALQVLSLS